MYENVIAVGEAKSMNGYTNKLIRGDDKKETTDLAVTYCKSLGR